MIELLQKIDGIEGDFRVRVGMMNPEHLGKHIEGLAEILNSPRFYRFIHIPIEAGSDPVLKAMKRRYTMEQIEAYVDYLRDSVKGIGIETDLIVGFPGETDGDFEESLDAIKRLRFDVVNISRFGARPHAAGVEDGAAAQGDHK